MADDDNVEMQSGSAPTIYTRKALKEGPKGDNAEAVAAAQADLLAQGPTGRGGALSDGKPLVDHRISNTRDIETC